MIKRAADWIFPVSGPPVKNGILITDNQNRILDVLDPINFASDPNDLIRYRGILCPGFVNTHCHLELSYLKGKVEAHGGLDKFIRSINKFYQEVIPPQADFQDDFLRAAEDEMLKEGIVAVGDIVSFPPSINHLRVKENSPLYFHSFAEVFGSNPLIAEKQYLRALETLHAIRAISHNNAVSLAPHATYSLSADLFKLLKDHIDTEGLPTTLHHLENPDEITYLQGKNGPAAERILSFGIRNTNPPPIGPRPLASLKDHLPIKSRLLLVHNTMAISEDLQLASQHFPNAWWCFCPGSNLFLEQKLPDLDIFTDYHHRITLGTDSLASNSRLSILEEMKILQKHFPETHLDSLLRWASLNGASFLGIENRIGSFETGKKPGINLIEEMDLENLRLTEKSQVRVLTSYLPS